MILKYIIPKISSVSKASCFYVCLFFWLVLFFTSKGSAYFKSHITSHLLGSDCKYVELAHFLFFSSFSPPSPYLALLPTLQRPSV